MIFKPYQTKAARKLKEYIEKASELKDALKDADPDAWVQLSSLK